MGSSHPTSAFPCGSLSGSHGRPIAEAAFCRTSNSFLRRLVELQSLFFSRHLAKRNKPCSPWTDRSDQLDRCYLKSRSKNKGNLMTRSLNFRTALLSVALSALGAVGAHAADLTVGAN